NQKQSKSQSNGANTPVLTIGLGDILTTNSANANTFPTNRSYLVWGANGQNMNDSGVPIVLNFGPATVSTLTSVSNRKWQVVETGGNVPTVKVSVPTSALTNFTPLIGNDAYVMVVADDAAFTTGIETIFLLTNGANQEALFDFDGTKYISFGVAHETVVPRHLTFDGTDDFVRTDYAPDLSSSFTVMAWIRNTGSNNPASDQAIISKSNGTTGFTLYDRTNNRIRMEWTDAGLGNNTIIGNAQIPPNQWHHVAVAYSGGTARLYIDGVQDTLVSLNPPAATSHAFSIGAQFRSQSDIRNFFKGDIEEVRIWDTALTVDQIRFVMNQEILQVATGTRGVIIPNSITKNDLAGLNWNRLTAYYTMNSYIGTHINDDSQNNQRGRLIVPDKVAVMQQNAPLPYESAAAGSWSSNATWQNGTNMQVPYDACIVDGVTLVAWNIVRTNHNISSNSDKVVLGLMVDSNILTANNDTKLEVSHYLKLDGKIDLEGRSQLIQTLNSDLDPTSSGILERDQQGTVDIYKYNYWSSPVGTPNNTTNNNTHTLNSVLRDGTNSANPLYINWTTSLDGSSGPPVRISTRWTYKFENAGNSIANWVSIGSTGSVKAGQGYIHKGSGASSARQNYTFQGKPHNGQIQFNTPGDMLNLFGNPYASALDANVFLTANLSATDGALYFWEHWGGGTHRLLDYQGGYAVRNLLTGIPAMSHPDVSQTGNGTITPGRYIPVGQGFFVIASPTGGTITFNNDQRAFVKENDATSNIHFRANSRNDLNALGTQTQQFPENNQSVSSEEKITLLRLGYFTNNGFKRQVALGFVNNKATDGFDKGYDAWNIDEQTDDMYFVLDNQKLVIQGVGAFDDTKKFPIGLVCQSHGKVKFVFDGAENLDENTPVFLFDKQTNTYYNIKENFAEIEIASAGMFNDRFVIHFTLNTLSTDYFENIDEQLSVFYLTSDHTLNILNTRADVEITGVQLYDLLGRLIESIALTNPSKSEIKIRLEAHAQNIYVAKLTTTNGHSISKKILITH
ncbi:MAG: LamG-like jellyroll fold domain-containing protein, partial [Flavobacteriaceae bacterium]|nr:LamG-like jellyroll fold domain-containing protein [Flavobacteriaceae bacterium]